MYHLNYQKSKQLFYIEAIGHIELLMLIDVLSSLGQVCEVNDLRIITDYRKAIVPANAAKEVDPLVDYIQQNLIPQYQSIRWASLASDYVPTTIGLILKELLNGKTMDYETFTTEAKICKWMNIDQLPLSDTSL